MTRTARPWTWEGMPPRRSQVRQRRTWPGQGTKDRPEPSARASNAGDIRPDAPQQVRVGRGPRQLIAAESAVSQPQHARAQRAHQQAGLDLLSAGQRPENSVDQGSGAALCQRGDAGQRVTGGPVLAGLAGDEGGVGWAVGSLQAGGVPSHHVQAAPACPRGVAAVARLSHSRWNSRASGTVPTRRLAWRNAEAQGSLTPSSPVVREAHTLR
jgi:hypothetical protein